MLGSCRRAAAVVIGPAVVALTLVMPAAGAKTPKPVRYVPLQYVTMPTTPNFVADQALTRSDCAVDVTPYVAATDGSGAAVTAAFQQAMGDALGTGPTCYPSGPSGTPQAVVYVPPGTYQLQALVFPNNLRLEVDAGATLQLPPNRAATLAWTPLIWWDTPTAGPPIDNVSLVGVGSDVDARKDALLAQHDPYLAPFNLASYFTMNLDPASTGSTNENPGVNLANVTHFLIQNVLAVQNDTDQPLVKKTPWPTSARPVLSLHANAFSPIGGPYVEPRHGQVLDLATVHSPRGYGPDQINGATDVDFHDVYASGGTALRVETDDSINGRGVVVKGATVDGVTASNIVGENCNRAVSLSPHRQLNGSVVVDNVWANNCFEGVSANDDTRVPIALRGSFTNATVTSLYAQGAATSQLDSIVNLWDVGASFMPVYVNPRNAWRPAVVLCEQAGTWTNG